MYSGIGRGYGQDAGGQSADIPSRPEFLSGREYVYRERGSATPPAAAAGQPTWRRLHTATDSCRDTVPLAAGQAIRLPVRPEKIEFFGFVLPKCSFVL